LLYTDMSMVSIEHFNRKKKKEEEEEEGAETER
jgi:hypothetical protein